MAAMKNLVRFIGGPHDTEKKEAPEGQRIWDAEGSKQVYSRVIHGNLDVFIWNIEILTDEQVIG